MMIVKGNENFGAAGPPPQALIDAIGGFTIMDLASKEEAIEEARKFMELHRKYWPAWDGECEVRLMYPDGQHP